MPSPVNLLRRPLVALLLALAVFGTAAAVLWLDAPPAHARRLGVSGYSGNPATNDGEDCSSCHGGGFEPEVSLEGPSVVMPGAQATFTLTVAEGQLLAAGLNVSATAGFLRSLGNDTRIAEGEITHVNPKIVEFETGAASFVFGWTAPTVEGTEVTLYGAGNSVDGDTRPDGDAVATVVKEILVASGPPPTPVPTATATDASPSETPTAAATEPATATSVPDPDRTPTGDPTVTPTAPPTRPPRWETHLPLLVREAPLR